MKAVLAWFFDASAAFRLKPLVTANVLQMSLSKDDH